MLDKLLSRYVGLVIISASLFVLLSIGLMQGLFYLVTLIPKDFLEVQIKILSNWGPIGVTLPICLLVILIGIVILIIELLQKKKTPEEVSKE